MAKKHYTITVYYQSGLANVYFNEGEVKSVGPVRKVEEFDDSRDVDEIIDDFCEENLQFGRKNHPKCASAEDVELKEVMDLVEEYVSR